jgi:hypothetical protein
VLVAIALQFLFPAIQLYIFYIVLIWVFAGLFIYRLPVMSRRVGFGRPLSTPPSPAPLASNPLGPPGPPAGTSAGALGFCMYCGSMVDAGTAVCPSCGRTLPLA